QAAGVLVKALEKVSDGEAWIDRTTIANVLSELSRRNGSTEIDYDAAKIASLTKREKEVVSLVCLGLRNKEIGSKLCISVATVRQHLGSIFSKLDISGRLDLMIYAIRHGMIDLRGPERADVSILDSGYPDLPYPFSFHLRERLEANKFPGVASWRSKSAISPSAIGHLAYSGWG